MVTVKLMYRTSYLIYMTLDLNIYTRIAMNVWASSAFFDFTPKLYFRVCNDGFDLLPLMGGQVTVSVLPHALLSMTFLHCRFLSHPIALV